MRNRFSVLMVSVLVFGLAAAGCGKGNNEPAAPPPASTPAASGATVGTGAGTVANTGPAATPAPAKAMAGQSTATTVAGGYVIVAAESKATYMVREKFVNRELPNMAEGSTSALKGELVVGPEGIQPSTVTVDLSTLKSDSSRRDNYIKDRTLAVKQFPLAEYRIQGTAGPAPNLEAAGEVHFQLTGTMKIHGVARPLTWDVISTRKVDALVWNATTQFKLTDFQITPPDIAGMLKADDLAKLTVQLTAKPEA